MSHRLTQQELRDQWETNRHEARAADRLTALAALETHARERARETVLRPFVETHVFATPIVHARDSSVVVGVMDTPWQRMHDEYNGTCCA